MKHFVTQVCLSGHFKAIPSYCFFPFSFFFSAAQKRQLQVCKLIEKRKKLKKLFCTFQTFIYDIQYWEQIKDERKLLKRTIVCFGLCQSLCQFRPEAEGLLLFRHVQNFNRKKKKKKKNETLWHELAQRSTLEEFRCQSLVSLLKSHTGSKIIDYSEHQVFLPLLLCIRIPGCRKSFVMLASLHFLNNIYHFAVYVPPLAKPHSVTL